MQFVYADCDFTVESIFSLARPQVGLEIHLEGQSGSFFIIAALPVTKTRLNSVRILTLN